jgi:hypothetical protein
MIALAALTGFAPRTAPSRLDPMGHAARMTRRLSFD